MRYFKAGCFLVLLAATAGCNHHSRDMLGPQSNWPDQRNDPRCTMDPPNQPGCP
jgi:hypothetical protein